MIQLSEVGKHYGDTRALGPVSFEVPRGKAVGFLGLNGVGKTTLLRILACDLRPTQGVARVGGSDVLEDPHAVRRLVGYLPESPPLYRDMSVTGYLRFVGHIRGVDPASLTERVAEVEELTGLGERRSSIIGELSHGYRQRVGVAQAIVHDPEVLILDEPTNGLDPVQISEMRELIRRLRGSRTILVSSHILTEISETCDEILVLHDGEVVASGTEDELSARVLGATAVTVSIRTTPASGVPVEPDEVARRLRSIEGVTDARPRQAGPATLTLEVDARGDVRPELCRALVEAGHDVERLDRAPRELERVFLELVGGGNA